MCLQKFPPSLQILWNLPLDSLLYLHGLQKSPPVCRFCEICPLVSLLSYLHVLAEIPPPQFADFVKSATGQFAKLPTCACRNSPPQLQILWNLPLDSLLSYLHVLAEIPPQFADFVKSATGQFAKLPTCACTNSPPVADFMKSATGQFAKLPICASRNSPPQLQILWNLPLDSLLSYLYVLAEIPPLVCNFVKSATGQFAKLPTYACRNSPPVCRFCEICHWTVC